MKPLVSGIAAALAVTSLGASSSRESRSALAPTARAHASVAFRIADPNFNPEGVAFDPQTERFFVSSLRQRRIVAVDRSGEVRDFVSSGRDGLGRAAGIEVDAIRRLLWVASVADEEASEPPDALFAFHLDTGRLARKIQSSAPRWHLDDVAVAPDGAVYASDPVAGTVYRVDNGVDKAEPLVPTGTLRGPNGLAFDAAGATLYISEYGRGIAAFALRSRQLTRLGSPEGEDLRGIDGLEWHDGTLLGVQNGSARARVLRLHLAPDASRVSSVDTLEVDHPLFDEPTLGVVAHASFYVVANSQSARLRAARKAGREPRLEPPAIIKIPLAAGGPI